MITNYEATKSEMAIALYYWQYGGADSFGSKLFDLISKADISNRERIRLGFPRAVEAWEEWQAAPNSEAYFKRYDIIVFWEKKADELPGNEG